MHKINNSKNTILNKKKFRRMVLVKFSNYCIISIAFSLILSACTATTSPNHLGKAVFQALKSKNFDRYEKHIIKKTDILNILQTLKKSKQYQFFTEKKRTHTEKIIGQMNDLYTNLQHKLKTNFTKIISYGEEKGIDWSKVQFKKILVSNKQALLEIENIPQQNIHIVFSFNKTDYQLRLNNNVQLSRGWVIVDGLSWELAPQ